MERLVRRNIDIPVFVTSIHCPPALTWSTNDLQSLSCVCRETLLRQAIQPIGTSDTDAEIVGRNVYVGRVFDKSRRYFWTAFARKYRIGPVSLFTTSLLDMRVVLYGCPYGACAQLFAHRGKIAAIYAVFDCYGREDEEHWRYIPGILISADGGRNWRCKTFFESPCYGLFVSADGKIAAPLEYGELLLSADCGKTWKCAKHAGYSFGHRVNVVFEGDDVIVTDSLTKGAAEYFRYRITTGALVQRRYYYFKKDVERDGTLPKEAKTHLLFLLGMSDPTYINRSYPEEIPDYTPIGNIWLDL